MEIDLFLGSYPEAEREMCLALGVLIKDKFSDIHDSIDFPAKMIAYSYGPSYKELLFTIFPSRKGVKLGFNQGVLLNNEHGLLEGTGKVSRYIQFHAVDQIENPAIVGILDEAYELYLKRRE